MKFCIPLYPFGLVSYWCNVPIGIWFMIAVRPMSGVGLRATKPCLPLKIFGGWLNLYIFIWSGIRVGASWLTKNSVPLLIPLGPIYTSPGSMTLKISWFNLDKVSWGYHMTPSSSATHIPQLEILPSHNWFVHRHRHLIRSLSCIATYSWMLPYSYSWGTLTQSLNSPKDIRYCSLRVGLNLSFPGYHEYLARGLGLSRPTWERREDHGTEDSRGPFDLTFETLLSIVRSRAFWVWVISPDKKGYLSMPIRGSHEEVGCIYYRLHHPQPDCKGDTLVLWKLLATRNCNQSHPSCSGDMFKQRTKGCVIDSL